MLRGILKRDIIFDNSIYFNIIGSHSMEVNGGQRPDKFLVKFSR